jgi:hypothetical protein
MRLTMVSRSKVAGISSLLMTHHLDFSVLGLNSSDGMQLLLQQYLHGIRDDPLLG